MTTYDDWKAGGENPDNLTTGPCGFCDGEGEVEIDCSEAPGWFMEMCTHCRGYSECGCDECKVEVKLKGE